LKLLQHACSLVRGALGALAFVIVAAGGQSAQAQAYPSKPVRLVAPAAPGGGIDLTARIISQALSEQWNQRVYVENRAGANFILGTDAVAKSPADGYTLLVTSYGALTVNPLAYPNLPYNPQRDLTPIMLLTTAPFVLITRNSLPVKTLPELIAYAREHPGKLNHASNSASTILASALLKSMAKLDYVDVNFKGGALAAQSTAAGDTDFAIVDLGSALTHLQGGRVRALAVSTARRFKGTPDIPTFSEAGVPGYEVNAWIVMAAPANLPPAVVGKISGDLKRAMATNEVKTRIESVANEVLASSPEETVRALQEDAAKWARLVKERDIRF
jgi:tripartite-type tricarboxylate transporter receptor subunit TctC